MSEWIDVDRKNVSTLDGELHVHFDDNDFGARYFSVRLKDVADAMREEKKQQEEKKNGADKTGRTHVHRKKS